MNNFDTIEPEYHNLTLLDTKTLEKVEIYTDFDLWFWTEGNGSCDCNRWKYFNDLEDNYPPCDDNCLGCKRFIIINHDFKDVTLEQLNEGYNMELFTKFCSKFI